MKVKKQRLTILAITIICIIGKVYATCSPVDCTISGTKSGWSFADPWYAPASFSGSVIIRHNGTVVTGTYGWNATGSIPGNSSSYSCMWWFAGGETVNVTCGWGYTCGDHGSNGGGSCTSPYTF